MTTKATRKRETSVEQFIKQIRKRLEERGVSISELSRRTGIARPYLSRVLSGHQNPSLLSADKIARELGLRVTTTEI